MQGSFFPLSFVPILGHTVLSNLATSHFVSDRVFSPLPHSRSLSPLELRSLGHLTEIMSLYPTLALSSPFLSYSGSPGRRPLPSRWSCAPSAARSWRCWSSRPRCRSSCGGTWYHRYHHGRKGSAPSVCGESRACATARCRSTDSWPCHSGSTGSVTYFP